MQKNVGRIDRIVRLVVGAVLLVAGLAHFGEYITLASGDLGLALGILALLVGAVLVVTGYLGTCPIYSVLGIDTLGRSASNGPSATEIDETERTDVGGESTEGIESAEGSAGRPS